MAGYDQTSLGLSFPTSAPALASRCDPAVALASGSHVPATFPPFVYLNSTWHPSQAKRGARGLSRPQAPGREPELCSKSWGSRESSQQDPASCRSLRSGPGGSGSKEARLDRRRGKGPLHRPRPPPPPKSPSGRRRQLERRKHFLIPEAATHGRRGRRPPPAATQLGTQAWAFPDPHSWGFPLQSSPPRPPKGGSARGLAPVRRLRRLSGPSLLCRMARGIAAPLEQRGTGALASGLQEPRVRRFVNLFGVSVCRSAKWGQAKTRRSPRERTHHHGGDRLARDVGHLDPNLGTKYRSAGPAAKVSVAAPSVVNKGSLARSAPL